MLHKVRNYAISKHREINHMYGKLPYEYHLSMVVKVALDFKYLIPSDQVENILSACWTHDLIEDAMQSYNDVYKNSNRCIAEITYALTNEKGRTRAERANDKYYADMNRVPGAVFVKYCDRIANITHSKKTGSDMFEKYRFEHSNFVLRLFTPDLMDMVDYMEELFKN